MSSEFTQPLLKISGLNVIYFGVIYALMRMFMGIGGIITHRLEKYFSLEYLLFIGASIIIISFFGFAYTAGILIIGSAILLSFGEGFNRIILEDEINKNIKSSNRTTILSISSLSKQLFNSILVFGFGVMADVIGVQQIYYFVAAIFAVCIVAAIVYMRRK